jgi:hypothetical protein
VSGTDGFVVVAACNFKIDQCAETAFVFAACDFVRFLVRGDRQFVFLIRGEQFWIADGGLEFGFAL